MPSEETNLVQFNQEDDEALSIVYAGLKFLIKKVDVCKNNIENLSATKKKSTFFADIQYV